MTEPGPPSPASPRANPALAESVTIVRAAIIGARAGLVEREALVEAIVLAAVAGEHVLVVGPPGTAKSEAARRVARALGGRTFEYLLGRFTEPNEIFGPVDLRRLREGVVEVETAGMLPEAEIAFLDEVFLGSTAILNTLLGVLNERVFRRGSTVRPCPLRVCVGASNALPDDESLSAFADRFLLRCFVEPVGDPFLETLLEQGWSGGRANEAIPGAMAALDALARAARAVELGPVRPLVADAVRVLRKAGVVLADRRVVRVQKLVAAAAVLDGRSIATGADLWPILYAVPTAADQARAREVLAPLLRDARNGALTAAAVDASGAAIARALRIAELAEPVLAADPRATVDGGAVDGDVVDPGTVDGGAVDGPAITGGAEGGARAARAVDPEALAAWHRRLEGIARDIDVGFSRDELPEELRALRARLAVELGGGAPAGAAGG